MRGWQYLVLAIAMLACSRSEEDPAPEDMLAEEPAVMAPGPEQARDEADRAITRRVREAIVADPSLSTEARNIEVSTRDGVVTLRGSVESAAEKRAIVATARLIAGSEEVDDRLGVEPRGEL